MSHRDLTRYDVDVFHHDSLAAFARSSVPGGVHSINYAGSPLDLWVRPCAGSDTAIVIFHGATAEGATTPVFTGVSVTSGIPAHVVLVSDPSLELFPELRMAWFAGNCRQPLQADLPAVLRHIFEALGTRHIIFHGSSLGGFASLYYSVQFEGSLAFVVNPQTVITEYWPRLVTAYADTCWGGVEAMVASANIDLRELYASSPGNTVAYLQNRPDAHTQRHMQPFVKSLPDDHQVYSLVAQWGAGHAPLPTRKVSVMLQRAATAQGSWDLFIEEFGLERAAPDLITPA